MYLVSLLPIVTSLFFYSLQLFLYLYIKLWALFTPFPLCFAPCPLHGAQLTHVVCPLGSVFCIFQFALSKWQWSNSVIASANYTQNERLVFSQLNCCILFYRTAYYLFTERNTILQNWFVIYQMVCKLHAEWKGIQTPVFSQLNCCILFYRTEYYRFLNLSIPFFVLVEWTTFITAAFEKMLTVLIVLLVQTKDA